jgi:signal transduction histidine kinase
VHARVVAAEGARLSGLIDDLLDFAALQEGRRTVAREPVDLGRAAARAADVFATRASAEGVDLAYVGSAEEGPWARGDGAAVARVLSNLLGNAWKHGRPARDGHPGRIRVRAGRENGAAFVEVEDDGPGLSDEERERVFERFARGARASATPGAGIGLALSRDLAHAMQGDLSLVPDGERTRFRLTLPVWNEEEASA